MKLLSEILLYCGLLVLPALVIVSCLTFYETIRVIGEALDTVSWYVGRFVRRFIKPTPPMRNGKPNLCPFSDCSNCENDCAIKL